MLLRICRIVVSEWTIAPPYFMSSIMSAASCTVVIFSAPALGDEEGASVRGRPHTFLGARGGGERQRPGGPQPRRTRPIDRERPAMAFLPPQPGGGAARGE